MADQIIVEYGAKIDKLEAELRKLEGKLLSVEKTGKKSGDELTKVSNKAGKGFKDAGDNVDNLGKKFKGSTKVVKDQSSIMTKAVKGVGAAIAAAFAIERVIAFANKTIEVRAEFQKLEAVLTNTLGSNSAAQRSLNMIQDFAAKTPFGVKEITEEFVKLANRGIRPSQLQLTRMGDVAATLGKPLSQLNEAILDVSNTERWNELGIKVQANGDKMTGTFRGITLEVERTEAGALSMIESFGKMEGVAGAMASISETLSGRISNLGDAFDKLYNTIGSRTDSVIGEAISMMGELVNNIADQMTSIDDLIKRDLSDNTTKFIDEQRKSLRAYLDAVKKDGGDVQEALANDFNIQVQILTDNLNKVQAELDQFDKDNPAGLFGTGFAEGIFKITDEAEKQRNVILVQKVFIEEQIKALGDLYQEEFKNLSKTTDQVIKADKDAEEKRKKELEAQYKLELERLKNQQAERENIEKNRFINSEINETQLNDSLEDINLEFLERRKAIEQKYGKIFAEIDGQILNVKVQNRKKEIEEAERLLKESLDSRLNALSSAAIIESNMDKELILKKELTEEDANRREIVRNIEVLEQRKQILKEAGKETGKDIIDIETEILNEKLKLYKLDEDAVRKSEDEKKKIREQILNETIGLVTDSLTAINDINLNNRKAEFDKQRALDQQQADEYLTRLQERNRQGKISDEQLAKQREKVQKDLAKKEAQIEEQQFKAEQDAALGRIAISTAEGIAKAIAASPVTFGLPFSAFVAAQGVLQAIVVKSQKPPKFKDGVIDFKGKGSETSDSNLVYISNRESIIKAKQSKKHTEALKAINNDTFEKYIDKFHIMPALKKAEKVKQAEKKRKSDMSENLYKAMLQNGLVDTSHLERLTKRNKSVRMENVDEIINGIGMHLKSKRGLQNKFGVKR